MENSTKGGRGGESGPVPVQQSSSSQLDKDLSLFSPCHKKTSNKNKNPHSNLLLGSIIQT